MSPSPSPLQVSVEDIKGTIRSIPDFPKPGILFKDIMPVLKDPILLKAVVQYFAQQVKDQDIQYVVGIESRGFILGTPLAMEIGAGFVPIRKKNKLPGLVERHEYDLEYGTDIVEIQADALEAGARVVLVDDLLATGGTANAACKLIHRLNADVISIQFMIELEALNGRKVLPDNIPVHSMIQY